LNDNADLLGKASDNIGIDAELPPPKTSPDSFSITRLYGPFTRRGSPLVVGTD